MKIATGRILFAACFAALCAAAAHAQDAVNENELFSGADQMMQVSAAASPDEEKKTVGFSGELTSALADVASSTSTKGSLYSYVVNNIFLDARMKRGLKAFANVETMYVSQTKTTDVALRELFLDFNFDRKVYLRTGKQVLQWGRCYLWNPTDLINVERKTFIQKIGYREGAYGMKLHIPFGADRNIYGFLDTGNAPSPEDAGGALKYEFLVGKTEMAFSGWSKSTYHPVLGYDFSTRLRSVDIVGELSASQGDNVRRLSSGPGGLAVTRKDDEQTTRASVAFTRGFRLGNFNDRVNVTSEWYYNSAGYDGDVFNDPAVYAYAAPVTVVDPSGTARLVAAGTKKDFMTQNGLHTLNDYSKYYSALFVSVGRFIVTDMTLNVNYIRNFCDGSGIVSAGVTYKDINDFSAGFLVNAYTGGENREYTYAGQKYGLQLTFGVAF